MIAPADQTPAAARTPGRRPAWRRVATFSQGMFRVPHLAELLGAERVLLRPTDEQAGEIQAVIGWAENRNTPAAIDYARRHGLPYWRAEDGFIRSVGLGVAGDPPLSIVLDDRGIYYDARRPSLIEHLLAGEGTDDPLADPALLARARAARARIVAGKLSKYNDAPPGPVDLGPPRRRVLVVDQTAGDLSIECGMASAASFQQMLAAALDENPGAEVLVKTHPDVLAGAKRGYLEEAAGDRVRLFAAPAPPLALIEQVDRVYVVSSQVGLEALLAGVPVTCFGAPFYAGWGLTTDKQPVPRRGRRRTIDELFAAAYLLYPRYVDPDSGAAADLETVLDHIELQRRTFERNAGTIFCLGFHHWKKNYVRAYLRCPGNRVVFARSARHAEKLGFTPDSRLLVWGQRKRAQVDDLAARHQVPVWRMEDGFLRSVGLGFDPTMPASLVVDRQGIYYDPTGPSDLESLLEAGDFPEELLERGRALQRRIVDGGLSKYNVGIDLKVDVPAGRRVLLVPGQVEDDASIQLGCRDIRTNQGLLEEVRRANPDAFILYKPHPDVVSGNRRGKVAAPASLCDHVVEEASLARCLAVAHEVHTLTSLTGFEALLRGLRVFAYGQPFYAGWGLTEDRHPVSRRTRRLTLDELVAGTLIVYPRYLNRVTGRFTTPEVIITQLLRERDAAGGRTPKIGWPARQLRKIVRAYRGVVHAP